MTPHTPDNPIKPGDIVQVRKGHRAFSEELMIVWMVCDSGVICERPRHIVKDSFDWDDIEPTGGRARWWEGNNKEQQS